MIGKEIAHYRIIDKIGSGGMGEIYLAEDAKLERNVALKFLPLHLTADAEARERFEREAKAAAALNHPNIVTIYEIGEHEGQVFIAMEYIEGRTLKEMMPAGTGRDLSLPLNQVIDITSQIASGLSAAHAKDIVHRDIKPQNILVDKDGRVKILDFGLAKLKGVSPLTRESSTLGTVAYMSPEQAMGREVDHRTDIWSLGVVLYEMLTGRLPFKGEYEQAIMYAIANEGFAPATSLRPQLPAETDRLMAKALEKDKAERYQHADDLAVDLRRLRRDSDARRSTSGARPAWASGRKTTKRLFAAVLLLAAAIIAAGLFLAKGRPKPGNAPAKETAVLEPQKTAAESGNSIAVLPFRDYRGQKEQDYFCYNITDAIINRLARVEGLKVRPTAAVMRFKDADKDPEEIASELNVTHIVSGTVQKEASRVRLTVQLIDVRSGFQAWNETYDEVLSPRNLFSIQDKISQAIADKLKLNLSRQSLQELSSAQPQNMEAYDYYSRGIYLIQYRYMISTRKEDFDNSVRMFKKAITIDPDFWPAYFGMFYAYRHFYDVTRTGTPEDYRRILGYLEKAHQISPNALETQFGMAYVYFARKDYDKWYDIYKKTKGSLSNDMVYMHGLGLCFQKLGLFEQAEKFYLKSIALDPYFFSLDNLGSIYMDWGKLDQAESCYRRLMDMAPNNILSLLDFVDLNIAKKNPAAAAEYLSRAEKMDPHYPLLGHYRSLLYAAKGDKTKALAVDQNPSIEIYALLNMNDEAFARIREDMKDDTCDYLKLLHSPHLKNLRSDPRFSEVIQGQKALYEERLKKYGDL